MKKRIVLILVGMLVTSTLAGAQGTAPPLAPRAISFTDTLGAAFSAADSARRTGSPSDFDFLEGVWEFQFQQRRPDGTFNPPFTGHWFAEKKRTANAFLEDHFRGDAVIGGLAAAAAFGIARVIS